MIKDLWHFLAFIPYYLKKLVQANTRVAYDVLTPTFYMKPGIIELPVEVESDHEILTLVNLITMSPGTLTIDLSDDRKKIYIYSMYVKDLDEFKKEIKNLEKRIHKALKIFVR